MSGPRCTPTTPGADPAGAAGAGPGLLVVVNTAAGSARRTQDQVHAAMTAMTAAAGGEEAAVELAPTTDVADLAGVLADLGDRRLVVLGGDGSLNAAVQALHESGRLSQAGAIGLVPLGTGNDFARSLGLPTDPGEAARAAVTGTPRAMALLVADDGQVALNVAHVGIGAAAAARGAAVKDRLAALGLGALGYPIGALAAGVSHRGWPLRVDVDGTPLHQGGEPVLMVGLGLGATVGGGAPLVPGADLDDGRVDVVLSLAAGPLARVGYALGINRGSHVHRSDVRTRRGRVVQITAAPGHTFPSDGDGQLRGPFTSRRWQVRPGAWQVMTPTAPLPT